MRELLTIFKETDRDLDDQYIIGSGLIYALEFNHTGNTEIVLTHTRYGSQDISLRCWFSNTALGQTLFPTRDDMDWFPIPRNPRTIIIGDDIPEGRYFLHVQNMQNAENEFKAVIGNA